MGSSGSRGRLESLPAPLRGGGGVLALLLGAGLLAAAVIELTGALDRPRVVPENVLEAAVDSDPGADPLAWDPDRRRELEEGAALGNSHVLYVLSPGGVEASAERTLRFEEEIAAAAEEHGVSAEMMEAMVMLESAGRPDVIAGSDPAAASGLAQIVASTGIDLLGMDIDLDRSRELTATIAANSEQAESLRSRARRAAERAAAGRREQRNIRKGRRLRAEAQQLDAATEVARSERARIDPRFDPERALDGMARYLRIGVERFGREDLAVTSYHMGIGNLGNVIEAFVGPEQADLAIKDLVAQRELSYTELFFDSGPLNHREAWEILSGLSDDSPTYYWRVLAAREILRLYREDPEELRRLDELHNSKATAEEAFHPESETRTFDDAGELQDGLAAGELAPIPGGRTGGRYGFRVGRQLGELTEQLGLERSLYRALRPEAVAALVYIAGRVQAITGGTRQRLTVTSAVRDQAYQDALVGRNPEATSEYSLHTTGYSFDILREYASDRQATAFQFVLDRLSAQGVIDYATEPRAIHVTVSERAGQLLE